MKDMSVQGVKGLAIHARRSVKGVDGLWAELIDLAEIVRRSLADSLITLADNPPDLPALVGTLEANEDEINRREIQIEESCLRVLALYEPVAIDLRRVATAFRVNGHLERIGDLSLRVARRARKPSRIQVPAGLMQLATMVRTQAEEALALLSDPDGQTARSVIQGKRDVASRYRGVRGELKRCLRDDLEHLTDWLRLLNTARNLESIADHAASIAEAVIFVEDGSTLRHHRGQSQSA